MAKQFKKTKLAAAIGVAAVSIGLCSAANAVVVVGGDNGWEVSFDGNINAFYVVGNYDKGYTGLGLVQPAVGTGFSANRSVDTSRVTSGFLPAFFSFNVKSPTVNGMTATGRFSFAPQITNANTKNQIYGGAGGLNGGNSQGIQGSSIDMREVLVNVDGSFGTVSFGRTLSIYGRNAILKDMTLFGVGQANGQAGAVTAGRIGRGYTYPNFNARVSYKTPNLGGLQAEFGLYDPSIEQLNGSTTTGLLDQTDTPRFEGEVSYTAALSGGSFQVWFDGLWQDIQNTKLGASDKVSVRGWGAGADGKMAGFELVGYYYDGQGLGRSLQFVGGTGCDTTGTICEEANDDGYYVQGSYTFLGKTKVGVSYGESNEDKFSNAAVAANSALVGTRDVSLSMWTVGVYHDVNSWLKLIAEYSKSKNEYGTIGGTRGFDTNADTFSIGSFFIW